MSRTGKTPVYNHIWYQQNPAKICLRSGKSPKVFAVSEISRLSWTPEVARLRLKIIQSCTLKYDGRGSAALLLSHHSNFQAIGEFEKKNLMLFCFWLKINNTLCCCFFVIFGHIIYGPPKCYTDHPALHHGWSVWRPRIFDFGQHCHFNGETSGFPISDVDTPIAFPWLVAVTPHSPATLSYISMQTLMQPD